MSLVWSTVTFLFVAGLFALGACSTEEQYYEHKEGLFLFNIERGPETADVEDSKGCGITHWSRESACVPRPCYKRALKNLLCNKTHIVFTLDRMSKEDEGTFKVIASDGTVLESRAVRVEVKPTSGPSTEPTSPANAFQDRGHHEPTTTAGAQLEHLWSLLGIAIFIRLVQEFVFYIIYREMEKDQISKEGGILTFLTKLSWCKKISLIFIPISCFMFQASYKTRQIHDSMDLSHTDIGTHQVFNGYLQAGRMPGISNCPSRGGCTYASINSNFRPHSDVYHQGDEDNNAVSGLPEPSLGEQLMSNVPSVLQSSGPGSVSSDRSSSGETEIEAIFLLQSHQKSSAALEEASPN